MPEETTSTPEAPAVAPVAAPTTPAAPAAAAAAAPMYHGEPFDEARYDATLAKARGDEKTAKKDAAFRVQMEKFMGIKNDTPATEAELQQRVEELTAENATLTATNRTGALRDLLTKEVSKQGFDPALALPYLRGQGLLDALDPSSDSAAKDIAAVVKSTPVQFKAAQTAVVSGAPFPAGSGGNQNLITPADLKTMSNAQINESRRTGLLEHLGIGSGK